MIRKIVTFVVDCVGRNWGLSNNAPSNFKGCLFYCFYVYFYISILLKSAESRIPVYYNLGLIFLVLAIILISHNNIILSKFIAEISENGNITINQQELFGLSTSNFL